MTTDAFSPEAYEHQLVEKLDRLQQDFAEFTLPAVEVFRSPLKHYRMRAEFKIWHEGETTSYAMFKPGEYRKPYPVTDFPLGSERIQQLMPLLRGAVQPEPDLRPHLCQVEFLRPLTGEALD